MNNNNKINCISINDTLYSIDNLRKIYNIEDNDLNPDASEESFQPEWSQEPVVSSIDQIASLNNPDQAFPENIQTERPDKKPLDSLPAYQAMSWVPGEAGVDIRPHVFDGILKKWVLLDSGSMCTAFPPEPGDTPQKGAFLRAVNGSRIQVYGGS